jgi:uncharacterized protein (TIGR03382 family)
VTARPSVASGCSTAGGSEALAMLAGVALWAALSRRQSSRRLRNVG